MTQLPLPLPRALRQRVDDALAHVGAGLLGYTGTGEHVARMLRLAGG